MSSRDWLPGRHCALHPGTRLHSSTRAMHPWVKTNDTETDDIFVCSYTVRQSKIQDGLIPPCTQNFSGMGGLYTRNQCNLNTLYMAKSVTLLERWLYQWQNVFCQLDVCQIQFDFGSLSSFLCCLAGQYPNRIYGTWSPTTASLFSHVFVILWPKLCSVDLLLHMVCW